VCYHVQPAVPYVIAASVVYGLDHIIRAIKTRFTTATLRTIPTMGLTRVDIPSLSTGWRAGQHVRLRVLSTSMGLWGMTEVHPFTISSAVNTEEGLVLMCKRTGKWTTKLYEMAQTTAPGEQGQEPGRRVKVMVEGPYGRSPDRRPCR
jgi:ferric-chelate reductase